MAVLPDSGLSLQKPPGFTVKYRKGGTYVSLSAACHWTARPTLPADEPTRTFQSFNPDPRAQTTQGPRHPTQTNVTTPETAVVKAGRRGGSAAVSATAEERTISAVDSTSRRAESRHCQEMADAASVSNHGQPIRQPNPCVGIQSVSDCAGVFIVGAAGCSTSGPILVDVRYREHQVIDLHHHQCLNQIAVDRISHPRSSSLDFQPTSPTWVVGINLVAQGGNAHSHRRTQAFRSSARAPFPFLLGTRAPPTASGGRREPHRW
jgi:hypothetical protein